MNEPRAQPSVTVVITAHNAARTIEAAVRSVLAQRFADWEAVVCDDASTDETRAIVARTLPPATSDRWRIYTLPHGGPAATRNHGIREARGEFVAFLDDDDSWEPDKLARCVRAMRDQRLDVVCHSEVWRRPDGSGAAHHYSRLFDPTVHPLVSLMRNNPFSTSALVVRRDALLAAGPFDTTLPSAEDYDLWIRLAMIPSIRIGFVDEVLGTYTVRQGSESSKIDRRMRAMLAIGRRYAAPLAHASRRGRLEVWKFRAKVYFTTGLRYLAAGSPVRGAALVTAGFLMWPFRTDWLVEGARRLAARRGVPDPIPRGA